MGYVLLAAAILSEVTGTVALKYTHGFSRVWPSLVVVVAYGASFLLMSLVLRTIPVSLTYAIWSGVGTALVALIGVLFLREPWSTLKLFGVLLIIGGVVALNLNGAD
jgi:small multidrug resistance pump